MALTPDFNEFCALLRVRHVEFVVVGAGRLLEALADFGFPDVPLTPAQILEPARLLEMGVAPVQIHVMSQIDGVSWDEVWATHERGPFGTEHVAFIGRAAFLRNKRAAGRPKDLADIHALREPE